jgi:hypothetical protein
VNSIIIHSGDLKIFSTRTPDDSFSKFNLSNIFEAQSEIESKAVFKELIRISKDCGKLVYWNNLVRRKIDEHMLNVEEEIETENNLKKVDRVFFYNYFFINTIHK